MAVLSNVVFGMYMPLSPYLQVCFSITNDVVMSISLMYEKAEAGKPFSRPYLPASLSLRQIPCCESLEMLELTALPIGGCFSKSTW